jgi:pimeloyl-ACP methyl ester carboxylesterase
MARPIKSVFGSNFLNKLRSDDYLNALNNNLSPLYKDTITNDQTETLGNISVPTLLIACENDTSVPLSSIDEIYNLIPNSEKIVIKSAGHNIHLEKPELLSAKIINYA